MAALRSMRTLTICAAATAGLYLASPALACEPGQCATGTAEAKPLKLKNHMRKPVASSATRTVKRADGEYRKVGLKRRTKATPPPEAQPTVTPAAAQAFASYEVARVRVVSPELIEEARLLADLLAGSSSIADGMTVIGADNVEVVESGEINDIDLKADTPYAISLDALSRDLAGSRILASASGPRDNDATSMLNGLKASLKAWLQTSLPDWLQRTQAAVGSAFAGLATLVRTLTG